jgi:hypothetical protein
VSTGLSGTAVQTNAAAGAPQGLAKSKVSTTSTDQPNSWSPQSMFDWRERASSGVGDDGCETRSRAYEAVAESALDNTAAVVSGASRFYIRGVSETPGNPPGSGSERRIVAAHQGCDRLADGDDEAINGTSSTLVTPLHIREKPATCALRAHPATPLGVSPRHHGCMTHQLIDRSPLIHNRST